jgi:hypothetical protein
MNQMNKHGFRSQKKTRSIDDTPAKTGGILRVPAQSNKAKQRQKQHTNCEAGHTDTHENHAAQNIPTPGSNNPAPVTTEIEEEAMEVDKTSNASTKTTPSTADIQPEIKENIAPHPHIPTIDGTHRITVKWTPPPTEITEFENDKRRLNEALFPLMTTLFKDKDGVFYR